MWPVWQDETSLSNPDNRTVALERQLVEEQTRARQLAASLMVAEEVTRDVRVKQLEDEIDALRESLVEAENAMALAAASDAGVSTDWVMQTVSRYSGELEEAQVHISNLEKRLVQVSSQRDLGSVAAHTREMRTPLTSLGVYTDLLLGETLGILGAQQIDVLQRMKTSIENLTSHLNQILLEIGRREQSKDGRILVDVRETIESAISSISSYMQAKRLKLDLIIADDLPLLPTFDNDFYMIVSRLLGSACLVSTEDGHVSVKAQFDGEIATASGFLLLSVGDSGESEGQELIYRLLSGQGGSTDEPLPDHLIQAGDNLSIAIDLVKNLGGRLWVDQDSVAGNTVSVLLPLTAAEMVP
jgi:signal transduction histidine kinase